MKQLRTIITMLVVLAMLISSVGVFAADGTSSTTFSDITPGTKVADAVTKLVGYGVINGYEDGTFKPDNTITRAEFAAIITRFKGIGSNLATDAVTGFSDLDSDDSRAWARPYVKAAADAGIINGFEDGTFRAAEPVTYEQAVKMIICAIGYEPVAKSEYNRLQAVGSPNLTWSSGYIAAANKHGVTANAITAAVTEPATRGTVAILTSNAYEVPKLETSVDSNGNVSYGQGSSTVGDDQYNTQIKIEGTVVANYYTSLEETDSDIEINEIVIDSNDDGEVTYEMTDTLRNSVNVEDLLGKKVTAYYAKDEFALVSIEPGTNSLTEIEESQIVRPLSGSVITYVNDSGKNIKVSVSGSTFIYNGKSGYINSLDELEPMFRNGTIEINETTNVVKVNSYDVMVVNSYSKSEGNGKIYLKYDDTYDGNNYYEFPSGGTSSKPEIYVNGTKKEFDSLSLSAYNVINYLESPGTSGPKIRRMYVTTGSKSGKVTSTFDDDRLVELNNTELYLTNDYSEYTPSSSGDKKAPFEMNDSYTYYLDYTGQIAAINYTAASSGSYELGYIIGADDEQIKLVNKSGAVKIYTMKSKVKVDGVSKDRNEVVSALKAVADTALAGGKLQSSYSQPVKYSLSSGEVNVIDTVATVEGGSNDTFCANELYKGTNVKPTKSTVTMNNTIYDFSSSTLVMYIPDDRTAEAEYATMTPSTAFAISENRQIEIFGADAGVKSKIAGLVLVYGMNPTLTLTGSSPYMIVTRTLNGDTIEGYKSAAKEVSQVTVSEDKFYTDAEKAWVSFDAVAKGDVIRILESGDEVVAIEMIYDASEAEENLNKSCPDVDSDGLVLKDTDSNDLYVYYAEAWEKRASENELVITTEFESDADKSEARQTVSVSSSTVYYSYDGSDIIAGDSMDVINDNTGSESRLIFVRTGSANAAAKVIYVLK